MVKQDLRVVLMLLDHSTNVVCVRPTGLAVEVAVVVVDGAVANFSRDQTAKHFKRRFVRALSVRMEPTAEAIEVRLVNTP